MNGPKTRTIPTTVLAEASTVTPMPQTIEYLAVTTAMLTAATAANGSRPTLIIK